ncbi:MAG: DOMON domain-containing protein [Brevinematales bacterium]|nr:DOMON domain-containing protein [Brevinematales bacterium]
MRFFLLMMGMVVASVCFAEGIEANGIKLQWEVVSNEVVFALEAPTTGWVSLGWGATAKMKDADYLIGYVTNGNRGVIEDHFGVSVTGHRRDTDLGGIENFRMIEAQEGNGITRLVFARSLVTKDTYDVPLVLDKPLEVILAYGRFDNTTSKHAVIAKVKITLKRK